MKLTHNVLASLVLSSVLTLSAIAQVNDGSNASRAPLPANRPNDFVRITQYTPNGSKPAKSVLVASHIGGPVTNQLVAVKSRTPASASLPVASADAAPRIASAQRE